MYLTRMVASGAMDKETAEMEWDSFMNGRDIEAKLAERTWNKKVLEKTNVLNKHRR